MEKRSPLLIALIWVLLAPLIALAGVSACFTVCYATAFVMPKTREVALNFIIASAAGGLAAILVTGGLIWLAIVCLRSRPK